MVVMLVILFMLVILVKLMAVVKAFFWMIKAKYRDLLVGPDGRNSPPHLD